MKNLQDLEKRNFQIFEEEQEQKEIRDGDYSLKNNLKKRTLNKTSHCNLNNNNNTNNFNKNNNSNNNQNFKHMPDHIANKLVDDILNSKF